MSALGLTTSAAAAVLRRDVLVFLSYRLRFVTQILSSIFSITLFHFLSRLVHTSAFTSPDAYFAFAVVGLLILAVLNSTLATPPGLVRQELVAGTFERICVSPFGPVGTLVSMLLFPFCYALMSTLILLTFAGLAFGLPVHWATVPLAIPLSILGAGSFMPFGILLLAVVIVIKQAAAGTTWVIAGISLIAGLYFPISLLPDWIRWASSVQPFTPATELLRHVLVNRPLADPAWLDLVKMGGFTVILLPLSVYALHRALAFGRRKGTLIEY
jgi:ABC-2 type transport system permease protein